jgi:hypothetical protein
MFINKNLTIKEKVKKILDLDDKYRNKELTYKDEDLFSYKNLKTFKIYQWDFCLPTICKKIFFNQKINEYPIRRIYNIIPFLKKINLKNFMIAGGFITALLNYKYIGKYDDIDIFIYGISDREEACKRVKELVKEIVDKWKNKFYKLIKTDKFIKIELFDINSKKKMLKIYDFQIIFRLYKSKSEILHGFDVAPASVGFSDDKIYFTSSSIFAFTYGISLIMPKRCSSSFSYRHIKYFYRGFNLCFPYLNIEELDEYKNNFYIGDYSQSINGKYKYKENNIILINTFTKKPKTSDYDSIDEEWVNLFRFLNNGIKNIKKNNYIYKSNNIKYIFDKKSIPIDKDYIIDKINYVLDLDNNILKHKINYNSNNNNTSNNLSLLKKILLNFGDEYSIDKCLDIIENKEKLYTYLRKINNKLIDIINNTKFNNNKINWICDNPGNQLTSSFNPVNLNEKSFYGKLYKDNFN